ncbi:MAG: hypothetical protein ACTSSH_08555, partial [Candidatus Heimdallarchaeota archaeon]
DMIDDFLEPTTKNNTLYDTLCDYIKGSAILHQYQRKIVNGQLIANNDDIIFGIFAFKVVHQSVTNSYLEGKVFDIIGIQPKFKREILDKYNDIYDDGMTWYKLTPILEKLVTKGLVGQKNLQDQASNRIIPAYYVKSFYTNQQVSKKTLEDHLNTNQQISNVVIKLFQDLCKSRIDNDFDVSIYYKFLNDLNTKIPLEKSVLKSLFLPLEDFITIKERKEKEKKELKEKEYLTSDGDWCIDD